MYATTSIDGLPAIQRDGRNVLSVWNLDWDFAVELCQLLNELEGHETELVLTEGDRKWLAAMDRAFNVKVQHA